MTILQSTNLLSSLFLLASKMRLWNLKQVKNYFFFDPVLSSYKFTFCQVHPPTQIFALSFHPPVIYVSVSACIFDHAMCMYSSLA